MTNDKAAATYHPRAKRPTTDGTNRIPNNRWPLAPVKPEKPTWPLNQVSPLTKAEWAGCVAGAFAFLAAAWVFLTVVGVLFGGDQ